jgi:hypothetical protein
MNTTSRDMRRVDKAKDDACDLEPGDFYFETDDRGQRMFVFCLPNASGCRIPLRPLVDQKINRGHSWEWDGNEDKPTLTPSVNAEGCWHGFVREGRMVDA